MMQATYNMPGMRHPAAAQQTYFDDLSIPSSTVPISRRYSRHSHGQQPRPGFNMRVSKPCSANSSPKSSIIQARRKTMMNDGQALRRQQQVLEYISAHYSNTVSPVQTRPARPLSWHPSSQLMLPPGGYQQATGGYPLMTPNMYNDYSDMYLTAPQFSPMVESYSTETSPSSTFSPLPSYPTADGMHYVPSAGLDMAQKPMSYFPAHHEAQPVREQNTMLGQGANDWNNFIMHGFSNTSPPTPETYPSGQQHLQLASAPDNEVTGQLLDEGEDDGEVLVGMGLYDNPDKSEQDPHLNNYRSTVSSLLGSTYQQPTESRGKGLKLEETWEPPSAEEEEDDDDDDDAEDDDEDN